uniref:Uncharacterized LOC100184366 n=1 Tax=Ciona intestinalis TaxID=7719 RepID=F7A165_CIOIN|nr:uncharacterized protein LOC100184366 [Ciona intestinalis]|eukprot:XP_002130243.1 uncharacterized protein LOC100184366 [Ciona intestinalis]
MSTKKNEIEEENASSSSKGRKSKNNFIITKEGNRITATRDKGDNSIQGPRMTDYELIEVLRGNRVDNKKKEKESEKNRQLFEYLNIDSSQQKEITADCIETDKDASCDWFSHLSLEERGRRYLFVIGDGGCGKTFKLRNLQHQFEFESRPPYRGVEVVLWCSFREVTAVFTMKDRLDLGDFICFLKPDYYRLPRRQLMRLILSKEKSMLLLMDGLEDFKYPLHSDLPNCKPEEKVTINVLLKTILSGKLLRRSRKLITGRTSQITVLKEEMRPDRTIIYQSVKGPILYELVARLSGDFSEQVLDIVENVPMFNEIARLPTLCIYMVHNLIEYITRMEVAVVPHIVRELYPEKMLRRFPMFQDEETEDVIELRRKVELAFQPHQIDKNQMKL